MSHSNRPDGRRPEALHNAGEPAPPRGIEKDLYLGVGKTTVPISRPSADDAAAFAHAALQIEHPRTNDF